MTHYLGINLGTTNSALCVSDGDTVRVVPSHQGGNITPSTVRIDAHGRVLVGQRARKYLESDPDNTRTEFKRLMGTEELLRFASSGQSKKPEELGATVLRTLLDDAEQALGHRPTQAVVTVPALFELPQNRATADAARLAGLERIELLQEPVASALAAGWLHQGDKPWLVYDLGGGTFDASLLEPREGLLRVVGHDGDNFLGGRDIDGAIVTAILAQLERDGISVDIKDPANLRGLRKLRVACEEAKIDASRGGPLLVSIPALQLGGREVDVELEVSERDFEALVLSLVDRSVHVCQRLLGRHGLSAGQLERVVLVGGPTMMPAVRKHLALQLGASMVTEFDPMTVVAQGAALFAATTGLETRAPSASTVAAASTQAEAAGGRAAWLQYPAVSADLTPFLVGKLLGEAAKDGVSVRFTRIQDGLVSIAEPVDADGNFAVSVSLLERAVSSFRGEVQDADGQWHALTHAVVSMRHGTTLGDPPLSRSIGVARENGEVHTYFERGTALPARRTYKLKTAAPLGPGRGDLSIPLVQGEFPLADLCRHVGTMQLRGEQVGKNIPLGTEVELTLILDRAGAMQASARVEGVDQYFEEISHLVVFALSPEDLRKRVAKVRQSVEDLLVDSPEEQEAALTQMLDMLRGADADADAGDGGDQDALLRGRRRLGEAEGMLHELRDQDAWPRLADECMSELQWTTVAVTHWGTGVEAQSLNTAVETLNRALRARDAKTVAAQRKFLLNLRSAAQQRDPDFWYDQLEYYRSHLADAHDVREAQRLMEAGDRAAKARDTSALRNACQGLYALFPSEAEDRARSLGSGVR